MDYLIAIKFRKRLLDTQQSPLKECVRSKEGFWSMLTYTGQSGQNVLGKILLDRREFIREIQTLRETGPDALRADNGQTQQCTKECALSLSLSPSLSLSLSLSQLTLTSRSTAPWPRSTSSICRRRR